MFLFRWWFFPAFAIFFLLFFFVGQKQLQQQNTKNQWNVNIAYRKIVEEKTFFQPNKYRMLSTGYIAVENVQLNGIIVCKCPCKWMKFPRKFKQLNFYYAETNSICSSGRFNSNNDGKSCFLEENFHRIQSILPMALCIWTLFLRCWPFCFV